jgi:hypothetical protein
MVGRAEAATGDPFEEPFASFARAYIRYQHSVAPVIFERLRDRVWALAHLDAGFRSLGRSSDITKLSHEVLFAAVRIGGEGIEAGGRYQRAARIQSLFDFCRGHGFLATRFVWNHGVRKPDDAGRIGQEFADRRAAKVPDRKVIDVLAHVYCEPKTLRDRVMSAVTAICMCVPIRIHEVLQLRADCSCSDERRNEDGRMVPTFGFRVFPGKGNVPQIKWVPDIMGDVADEAFNRLFTIGTSARTIAKWYVSHPDRMYLPPDSEHFRGSQLIRSDQVGDLIGQINGAGWAVKRGLRPQESPHFD